MKSIQNQKNMEESGKERKQRYGLWVSYTLGEAAQACELLSHGACGFCY